MLSASCGLGRPDFEVTGIKERILSK